MASEPRPSGNGNPLTETLMILPPDHPLRRRSTETPNEFAQQILQRLPLAEAGLALLAYALPDSHLNTIFNTHRGRCYEDILKFPQLVRWLLDALVEHQGSGRQAHLHRDQFNTSACDEAYYGKLRRIPLNLSVGFLRDTTQRLLTLLPPKDLHSIPLSLQLFEVEILDGKCLKKVAKRLRETRGAAGKLLGGKLLVAYRPRDGMILDMAADIDGESNEAKLVSELVPRRHQHGGPAKLFVGDRLFCALKHFNEFTANSGHFVVRYSERLSYEVDPEKPAIQSVDSSGRTIIETWGWAGKLKEKNRRYVRHITLLRSGDEPIVLLTDLCDSVLYPAGDLLKVYHIRWSIESAFQRVTEIFAMSRFIGSTAQATVFQASMCFVLSNVARVLQGIVVSRRPEKLSEISEYQFWKDWHRQLVAVKELVEIDKIIDCIPVCESAEEMKLLLDRLLSGEWKPGWKKTKNAKPRPHRVVAKKKGAHTSVHRRRQAAKAVPTT